MVYVCIFKTCILLFQTLVGTLKKHFLRENGTLEMQWDFTMQII